MTTDYSTLALQRVRRSWEEMYLSYCFPAITYVLLGTDTRIRWAFFRAGVYLYHNMAFSSIWSTINVSQLTPWRPKRGKENGRCRFNDVTWIQGGRVFTVVFCTHWNVWVLVPEICLVALNCFVWLSRGLPKFQVCTSHRNGSISLLLFTRFRSSLSQWCLLLGLKQSLLQGNCLPLQYLGLN